MPSVPTFLPGPPPLATMILVLGLLCILVAPGAWSSNQTTCVSCSVPGQCHEIACSLNQSFCLVNYTGSDKELLKNLCMDKQTCQDYVHKLNNASHTKVSCCQGNCSVPTTTSPPSGGHKNTTCSSCPDSGPCHRFLCPAGRDTCLSIVEVQGDFRGKDKPAFRRNGSCVAPEDCQPGVYSLSYGSGRGLWVNVTCCSGEDCGEPSQPESLPKGTASDFLCPVCSLNESSCDENSYLLCFQGETSCVSMNVVQLGGNQKSIFRGCGSKDLCQLPENHTLGLDYQLVGKPSCSSSRRAVLGSKCRYNGATGSGAGALLPALLAVGMATWLA
ncbi:uncharacterized protein LOC141564502 [Sminthopsis crassicaudata]|uniref:uncharacterized protein LOC141564502 n=1 Tax=Sminthopsis crassicaudata TaxID=9301 RepID=UPI003D6813A3